MSKVWLFKRVQLQNRTDPFRFSPQPTPEVNRQKVKLLYFTLETKNRLSIAERRFLLHLPFTGKLLRELMNQTQNSFFSVVVQAAEFLN